MPTNRPTPTPTPAHLPRRERTWHDDNTGQSIPCQQDHCGGCQHRGCTCLCHQAARR
ncbi:hypothetical protein [Nonomuraea glycinis]|uniref:hypothetical protein n=1 Tax=Nonomuraea glycinis TaxID=2047744 RepID=UPI0033A3590A